jgi:hypothetical protein
MRLTLLFLVSGLLVQSFAQVPKWHANVQVRYGGIASFEPKITSYINRELRALGDIDLTDKNPDYLI